MSSRETFGKHLADDFAGTLPVSAATLPASASDGEIQAKLAEAARLFAERFAERDGALAAFPPDAVTATEVMVTVSAMLKAVNLQVFELGMWQSFNGR